MLDIEIQGEVAAGFERVGDVFRANWNRIEVGASFSVVHRGRVVVDLWAGYQDRACTRPWERDTIVNVYSTTKGLASVALAILADEGKLDYQALVTDYWPEFGAEGKDRVTVAQLLSHQAGVCGVSERITTADLYDWEKMTRLLAAQRPLWEPGRGAGYHAVTWGYLGGELIRRITGDTLGAYFRDRVAEPLGVDFHIGVPDAAMGRIADMIGPNHARRPIATSKGNAADPASAPVAPAEMPALYPIALQNPVIRPFQDVGSTEWRRAEIAAANGHGNARAIARVYGAMANGGEIDGRRIITPEGIAQAVVEEVGNQPDLVLGRPMRRARGFMLNTEGAYGPNPGAFGHAGAGGSTGFADPDAGIGIGYAMNQMENDVSTRPRSWLLVEATYDCLSETS